MKNHDFVNQAMGFKRCLRYSSEFIRHQRTEKVLNIIIAPPKEYETHD